MENYKEEIISNRLGCLGGSDAKMIAKVSKVGEVQNADLKRLAECKGLASHSEFSNESMLYGDFIEQSIFKHMKSMNDSLESNPLFESKVHVRRNVRLICHIDIQFIDHANKMLRWIEVKATDSTLGETYKNYKEQLYTEWVLGREYAERLGYGFKLHLYHYDASNKYDVNGCFDFDINRLCQMEVMFRNEVYDIANGLDIIDGFLETLMEYKPEIVDYDSLPSQVQAQLEVINEKLVEIKKLNDDVDLFKSKMYELMVSEDIKSIDNPYFNLTRIDESKSVSFDKGKFEEEHPKLYKKYLKTIRRKGYVKLTLKGEK